MADVNSQVALGVNAPDPNQGLGTLSKILTLGQQGLSIRGQQSQNQSLASKATIDSQNAKENQALAGLMSDPIKNGIVDQDGNPTKDAQTIIMRAAPTTGSEHTSALLDAATKKVGFNSAVNSLRTSERQEVASTVGGAAAGAQNPQDVLDALDTLVASKKGTPEEANYQTIASTAKEAVSHLATKTNGNNPPPAGQEPWRQGALNLSRSILPASATVGADGIAAPQGVQIDTGENIQPGTTAAPLQGGAFTASGAPIKKVAPPGYTILPNGQLARISGGATSATPIPVTGGPQTPGPTPTAPGANNGRPRTAQDDAPSPNAPKAVQENYARAAADAQQHVMDVRKADSEYGNNISISNTIRHLAPQADTGPGKTMFNNALAGLGVQAGSNYQELGAFLDRQAASLRSQMGLPGTNAGAEDSKAIAGNTNYTPQVIMDKNDYTQSLVEGAHQYRHGLDRVEGFSGQASPTAVSKFKSAWADNFDPNVYKADIAKKEGPAAFSKFVNSLDPKEAATLANKRKNLQSLSNGQIPQ